MIRLGLWGARGDRRGLAIQGGEFARHMKPCKVMGFDLRGVRESQLPLDWSDYERPGTELTVMHASRVTRAIARDWMQGLDVVWACETWYQPDLFPEWARQFGVATVQHVNPEFYRYDMEPDLPRPTLEIAPSSWRLDQMSGVRDVLPCPVPLDRLSFRQRPLSTDVTFLHIVGVSAAQDRNGTDIVAQACKRVRTPCRLIVRHQGGGHAAMGKTIGKVRIDYRFEDVPHYWDLYDDGDVLLMPRRYGGQCLVVQEAAACGMASVMTDCDPQRADRWPVIKTPINDVQIMATQAGEVDVWRANAELLAEQMDALAHYRWPVHQYGLLARQWAEERSWDALKPAYEATLERAIRMAKQEQGQLRRNA